MKFQPFTFNYHESQLIEVPSFHFNSLWADWVNKICKSSDLKPDAIAVELGPKTALAIRNFIKELGIEGDRKMPVMLGLLKRNRRIRASLKQKALKIQAENDKDLSELPPDLLSRELGYRAYNLFCLSPTDSIIEAIRCSIEMNLPLYGVDLDEFASGDRNPVLLYDPLASKGDLIPLILQNASYAAIQRDKEIDTRREIVMASRIKHLLGKYRRILFVFGIAHWLPIRNLLKDSTILPSLSVDSPEPQKDEYIRVVIHPFIAIRFMDLFPAFSLEYEIFRTSMNGSGKLFLKDWKDLPFEIFEYLLNRAYKDYFRLEASKKSSLNKICDLESLRDFEKYLWNLCLLNHRLLPDFFMTIKAAHQFMSREFVKSLTKTLLDFPWASPEDFPEYSIVIPPLTDEHSSGLLLMTLKSIFDKRKIFILPPNDNNQIYLDMEIPGEWDSVVLKFQNEFGILHTWIPWEYLISGMSVQAIQRKMVSHKWIETKVFNGTQSDGIDLKRTLLSSCRGDDRLYVRHITKRNSGYDLTRGGGFPVVWIFNPEGNRNGEWAALYESCDWMAKYVRDRTRIEEIIKKRGNKMIALIGYGELNTKTEASKRNPQIRSDRYHGLIIYQPICWSKKQFAHWIEMTGYSRNPFCNINHLGKGVHSDLNNFFEEELGIKIEDFDWQTVLILLGMPFADKAMTVVIPDGYRINPFVTKKAKEYRIEIQTTSISSFPKEQLERVIINHMAPAIIYDPKCKFPKRVGETIGESETDYRNLVPRSILEFGDGLY